MSEEITTLELGFNSLYDYRLHPSVPLAILELYYRRKTKSIAGTLLGIIYPNRIDITNCYAVPLLTNEDETNKMNIEVNYFISLSIHFSNSWESIKTITKKCLN